MAQKSIFISENLPVSLRSALEQQLQRWGDIALSGGAMPAENEKTDLLILPDTDPDYTGSSMVISLPLHGNPLRLGDILKHIGQKLVATSQKQIRIGTLTLNTAQKLLTHDNGMITITLTDRETDILRYLAEQEAYSSPRENLLQDVFGYHADTDTHTLETHIYRLRQKLETHPETATLLNTTENGYSLCPENKV